MLTMTLGMPSHAQSLISPLVQQARQQGVITNPATGQVQIAPLPPVDPLPEATNVMPIVPPSSLPKWLLPVGIGVGVLGVVYFLFVRR